MKLKLESKLDNDKVFGNVPEAERTDEMREHVSSALEEYDEGTDDDDVIDSLLKSAGGQIDAYLKTVRDGYWRNGDVGLVASMMSEMNEFIAAVIRQLRNHEAEDGTFKS